MERREGEKKTEDKETEKGMHGEGKEEEEEEGWKCVDLRWRKRRRIKYNVEEVEVNVLTNRRAHSQSSGLMTSRIKLTPALTVEQKRPRTPWTMGHKHKAVPKHFDILDQYIDAGRDTRYSV